MLDGYPSKTKRAPPFLPAPYLVALGNIAAYWAYLEFATEIAIWAFLDLDYWDGSALTTHMGMVTRVQTLTMLAERNITDKPQVHEHLLEMLKMIDTARNTRNDYIHGFWKHSRDKKTPYIETIKRSARGKVKTVTHQYTLPQLQELAAEIHWLTQGLQTFIEVTFPDFPVPWPRTDAPPTRRNRG